MQLPTLGNAIVKKLFVCNVVPRIALLCVAFFAAPAVYADVVYNVNTTADLPDDGLGLITCHTSAGTCSLRAAIMKANQFDGNSIITVPAGTYTLTIPPSGTDGDDSGDLNFATPIQPFEQITVIGAGAGRTIIDANQIDRAIDVSAGRFAGLVNLTIRNGVILGANGGGIRNAGFTAILGCVIEANNTYASGSLGNGAGIYSSGPLSVSRSTIRDNNVQGVANGGGIAVFASADIRESTIYGNVARNGGGIFVTSFIPSVIVVNSTISGNAAYNDGGGIYSVDSFSGDVVGLYNTSVIGNDASSDSDKIGRGGGIYALFGNGAAFYIVNTLIANNTNNGRAAFDDCIGNVAAYGYNLFSQAVPQGCVISGNGSAAWGEVSLVTIGPLQDNGGPTLTHALLQNSEAINGTLNQGCVDSDGSTLITDQRGAGPRGTGRTCDVGAFEYGAIIDHIFGDGFQ